MQAWVDDVNRHAEGFGYLLDGNVGHAHQFALLYAPDVLACQSGTVGEFLLTSVVFGGVVYQIGQEEAINITGSDILLFDRKSGRLITAGSLKF